MTKEPFNEYDIKWKYEEPMLDTIKVTGQYKGFKAIAWGQRYACDFEDIERHITDMLYKEYCKYDKEDTI